VHHVTHDPVVLERLGVLAKPKLVEPVADVLARPFGDVVLRIDWRTTLVELLKGLLAPVVG
tara:strand:- start:97 stop:279 length:183 start_codon:yes stop_codon:yes gene_type:complete